MRSNGKGATLSVSSRENAFVAGSSNGPEDRAASRTAVSLLCWGLGLLGIGILLALTMASADEIRSHFVRLLPWIAVLAIANLFPVSGWYSTSLAPDLPIAVAAALVLSPTETAIVAFLGAFDPKEFRGRISLPKAIFNRTQVAIADLVGSIVGHAFLRHPSASPLSLPLALLVLASIVLVNISLVGPLISLERRIALADVVRRLHPGAPVDLCLTFLTWGVLGAMLAALYAEIQGWALVAFLAPALLGRQVLDRSQMFLEAVSAFKTRERALTEMSRRIQDERTDERRLIAADLHDEVLQPLFKVSLMAHVLKADLAKGRLLDIDEDLPQLLSAAEIASETLRDLIGDLRRSTLGRGGLDRAVSSFIRAIESQGSIHVVSHIEQVHADPAVELAVYQIAKEALTNAIHHSRAGTISVSLIQSDGDLVLSIADDGIGFDPSTPKDGHYGLHILAERAAAIGATLFVDSFPGGGCTIRVIA